MAVPAGAQQRVIVNDPYPDWPWDGDSPDCQSGPGERYAMLQVPGIVVHALVYMGRPPSRGSMMVCVNNIPLRMEGDTGVSLIGYVRAGNDHVFLFDYDVGNQCSRIFRVIVYRFVERPMILDGGEIGRCADEAVMRVVDNRHSAARPASRARNGVEFRFSRFSGDGEGEWRRVWYYADGRLELLSPEPAGTRRRAR